MLSSARKPHEKRNLSVFPPCPCFVWLNRFFWCCSKCAPFFSLVVAFWTDEHFWRLFGDVHDLTDTKCIPERNFLRFYVFFQSNNQNRDRLHFCVHVKTFWQFIFVTREKRNIFTWFEFATGYRGLWSSLKLTFSVVVCTWTIWCVLEWWD